MPEVLPGTLDQSLHPGLVGSGLIVGVLLEPLHPFEVLLLVLRRVEGREVRVVHALIVARPPRGGDAASGRRGERETRRPLPAAVESLDRARMDYTVVDARYVRGYVIWVKFEDGTEGEVDLAGELWGPVFEPLKDPARFRNFKVAEYGTIEWPNGADLAPEFLYQKAHVPA